MCQSLFQKETLVKVFFCGFSGLEWGGGHFTSFFLVPSTKVGTTPQKNFLTFSFNSFATLV